jgi:hypothetical protein
MGSETSAPWSNALDDQAVRDATGASHEQMMRWLHHPNKRYLIERRTVGTVGIGRSMMRAFGDDPEEF